MGIYTILVYCGIYNVVSIQLFSNLSLDESREFTAVPDSYMDQMRLFLLFV